MNFHVYAFSRNYHNYFIKSYFDLKKTYPFSYFLLIFKYLIKSFLDNKEH